MKTITFLLILLLPVLIFCKSVKPTKTKSQTVCFLPKNNAPVGLKITFTKNGFTGFYLAPISKDPISGTLIKKTSTEYLYKTKLFTINKTIKYVPHKKLLLITPPNNADSIWTVQKCSQVELEFK